MNLNDNRVSHIDFLLGILFSICKGMLVPGIFRRSGTLGVGLFAGQQVFVQISLWNEDKNSGCYDTSTVASDGTTLFFFFLKIASLGTISACSGQYITLAVDATVIFSWRAI